MEKKIKKIEGSQIEISVSMPFVELERYIEKAFLNLKQGVSVKGFREGKAPQEIVEKEIGRDKAITEASNLAVREVYEETTKQGEFEPIGYPQAEILKLADNNPFEFKIISDVLPKLDLPDIEKIAQSNEKKDVQVTEKELEDAIFWVRKSRATFKDLDREAQEGDFVEIDYQSPQVENNKKYQDGFVLGKGHLIKGFEDNVISMKAGENKEFKAQFPEEYFKKELAGKEVDFQVVMNKVKEMILPELNDDFAKNLGKFENVEDLKKNIRNGIKQEKELEQRSIWRNSVLEEVSKQIDCEMPKSLVLVEQERLNKQDIKEEGLAEKRIKSFLILREIGKNNKIEVKEEEITQAINSFLATYPQDKQKDLEQDRLKEYYKGRIFEEKVLKIIDSYAFNSNSN